jgi:hypothetical protein
MYESVLPVWFVELMEFLDITFWMVVDKTGVDPLNWLFMNWPH